MMLTEYNTCQLISSILNAHATTTIPPSISSLSSTLSNYHTPLEAVSSQLIKSQNATRPHKANKIKQDTTSHHSHFTNRSQSFSLHTPLTPLPLHHLIFCSITYCVHVRTFNPPLPSLPFSHT